jgi:hypothetical protein
VTTKYTKQKSGVNIGHVCKPAETCGELLDAMANEPPPKVDLDTLDQIAKNRGRHSGGRNLKAMVKSGQLPFTPKVTTEKEEALGPTSRRREMLDYLHEG